MTTDDLDDETLETIAEYLRLNPDATTPEVLGATDTDPAVWGDVVDDALATAEPHRALETPDTGAPEGDSRDANPTLEADKTASPTPDTPDTDGSALFDALEWFHQQLDRELPDECDHDTPRDYYRDGRGWDADTIDEKLLGYAPPNAGDEILEHLRGRGYDTEAILSTGLFTEDLSPLWQGRYVLPYFDAEGRPAYAIARETSPKHPEDFLDGKYGKLAHTKEYAEVEEPIYGLDTVREGEPVLITEGIADAITAQQAGYPCLSPVTVQFKKGDREDLLEALDERDVDRAYLIQDAERPTSDVDDRDRLTLQQFGPGVKGAVRTAAYLSEHGLEARVVDLPRPGLEKVDLDDYLQGWSHDLGALLLSANPVDQHPAHDPDTARDVALDAAEASDLSRDLDAVDTDGDHSALFDLTIRDVTGLSWDYRGPNPLGHHGESENYCVLLEGHGVAYDHKYKAAYNALTYLLVDAGERRPASPNGRLEDAEVFAAWRHAKEEDHITDDDPIPLDALQHVARETTEWDGDLVEQTTADGDTFDGLPSAVYNTALEAVREDHGIDPGRSPVSGGVDPDAEPVAPLALAKLDALSGPERERYARKQGLEIPSTDDAREDLRDALFRELRAGNQTVLDFPTAGGKSHTVATTPWLNYANVTGEAPVVQLHPTTDARDDAAGATADSSAQGATLKGRKEKSPLARGDHDPPEDDEDAPDVIVTIDGEPASEWFDQMCEDKGLPFSTALALARDRNDQGLDDLPPQGQEDPAVAQWDGLPRDDDGHPAVDVIHATHQFAYVPSLRSHTNVVLDEQPDFTTDLSQDRIRRAVNAYLQEIDAPVSTWERFVTLARADLEGGRSDAARERDAVDDLLGTDPGTEWYIEEPDAHALAPDLTRAIWNALRWEDPDINNRQNAKVLHEPPRLDAGEGDSYAGVWLSVVIDEENNVQTIRATPDFSQAHAVIGLDAHPSMPMWELNAGPELTRDAVLDPTERRLWRRYERGLTVVQVGDATRPRSGPDAREWMNDERVRAVLERLRDHYGDGFNTAITTAQVESAIRRLLEDVTDEDLDDDHLLHFGEEKSRNPEAFIDAVAGYVYGCMDPGDGMILDALAELGLDAEPATATTEDGDTVREKGRTFDGADADTAQAVLASVRENHVAQGAGRYARNPDDPDSRAVVFAQTDALPAGFADLQVPGVEWLATDTQRKIIDTLADRPTATSQEIADAADCSKEHVRQTLERLEGEDLVARHPSAGEHGADVYREDGAEDALLDLGVGQIANNPLEDTIRWSLVVWDLACCEDRLCGDTSAVDAGTAPADGHDPPPEPGD